MNLGDMKNLSVEDLKSGSGWVTVFPRGKHFINKYEMVLNCDDKFFASVQNWWDNSTFKKPYLDKGHGFDESYGTFSEMRITDKGLEMLLTLNDEGKKLVKAGQYEYLSPTFSNAKDSNGAQFENVIFTVSLVNYPALLVLDKIQEQIALSFGESIKKKTGGSKMELREMVASKLKLNLASDDGSILTEIDNLIKSGASIADLELKIEGMKTEIATANEAKSVAEATLSALQLKNLTAEAERIVDEAIVQGQYVPALKEMKVAQYLGAPETVMKELSVLPKNPAGKQQTANYGGMQLSAQDEAILLSAGYDLNDPKDRELAQKFLASQEAK